MSPEICAVMIYAVLVALPISGAIYRYRSKQSLAPLRPLDPAVRAVRECIEVRGNRRLYVFEYNDGSIELVRSVRP